jgi:sugar O-acyltransferase (sialic acid O-acetyltransferase NeuD family)
MTEKNKIIIFGTGETARLAYEYFSHDSSYSVIAFAVNKEHKQSDNFLNLPLEEIENLEKKFHPDEYLGFVALGSGHLNRDRQKVFGQVKGLGYKCASYISSKAFRWRDVQIGENCFIMENNVLQSGVKIKDNVTLWSGNHIGHLSTIESHCFISSHVVISGNCSFGQNCFVGVNSSFADGVKIGKDNFIGLGTIINHDTENDSVYTGNPGVKSKVSAKRLSKVKE